LAYYGDDGKMLSPAQAGSAAANRPRREYLPARLGERRARRR
jgi:hypothetical protein